MKTRARLILAALAAAVVAGLAGPAHAEAKYKIHWYLGHKNLDYFEEAAETFKTKVESESKGDISVSIVTAANDEGTDALNQSPSAPEIAAKVQKGEIEMGHSFTDVMGTVDPRLYAFEAPYLFRDYGHMEGVFEGPVGQGLLADFRKQGMVGLSFTYSGGGNGVATMNREIRRPEDLKGLKVGVYGDSVNAAWLKSLGATPVAIHHDLQKIPALMKDGTLDAVVITWRNFERTALNQGFKYFNLPGSSYLVSVTYANAKFFDSLPANYQALILKASQEAGRTERAKTIELNESAKREMVAKGVRPTYLDAAGRKSFAAALAPVYEKELNSTLGKDFVEQVRKTGEGAHPKIPTDRDFASR